MKPIEILLVEDNPADVELTRETMHAARVHNTLHVTRDGEEAMRFLRRQAPFEGAPTPDLILLDLNLPRKDGREILAEVKQDPALQIIPVVVLTSSEAHEDVIKSYRLHANAYVQKPVTLNGCQQIVNAIDGFWLSIVKLPGRG